MADSNSNLSRTFLAERDLKIFEMKRSGLSAQQIAKRFGITTRAAQTAVARQLQKMSSESVMAYPEVLQMELERLDSLMQALWPLTQHRIAEIDGKKFPIEPDLKATTEVRAIMAHRMKLLGMDRISAQDVQGATPGGAQAVENIRSSVHGAEADEGDSNDPKTEVIKTLKLMGETGVLPIEDVERMIEAATRGDALPALEAPKEIADAEIVLEEGTPDATAPHQD